MDIKLSIPNLKFFADSMKKAPELTKNQLQVAVTKSALEIQRVAREEAPVQHGALRNSIKVSIDGFTGRVYTNLNYAIYVHEGTGLYGKNHTMIVPKNAKVLATKINPGWGTRNAAGYFIIGMHSKGQKPNPFMKRAVERTHNTVVDFFKEAEKNIVRSIKA